MDSSVDLSHVSSIVEDKSQDSVHKPQLLKRKESRSQIKAEHEKKIRPWSICVPGLCLSGDRPKRLVARAIWSGRG